LEKISVVEKLFLSLIWLHLY